MLEYEIPSQWTEVFNMVDGIGNLLRTDAISKNFNPPAEYRRQLNIATGCYMYLVVEYKKYRAIKENNEVSKYVSIKNEQTVKFVSASTEREASAFVAKERYYRDLIEGWMLASESAIYTIKKHLDVDTKEERLPE